MLWLTIDRYVCLAGLLLQQWSVAHTPATDRQMQLADTGTTGAARWATEQHECLASQSHVTKHCWNGGISAQSRSPLLGPTTWTSPPVLYVTAYGRVASLVWWSNPPDDPPNALKMPSKVKNGCEYINLVCLEWQKPCLWSSRTSVLNHVTQCFCLKYNPAADFPSFSPRWSDISTGQTFPTDGIPPNLAQCVGHVTSPTTDVSQGGCPISKGNISSPHGSDLKGYYPTEELRKLIEESSESFPAAYVHSKSHIFEFTSQTRAGMKPPSHWCKLTTKTASSGQLDFFFLRFTVCSSCFLYSAWLKAIFILFPAVGYVPIDTSLL